MARPLIFVLLLCVAAGGVAAFVQDEGPMERREHRMGPPMGPSSMVVCKDHIFILTGVKLVKVDPDQMKVVAELEVAKPPMKKGGEEEDK